MPEVTIAPTPAPAAAAPSTPSQTSNAPHGLFDHLALPSDTKPTEPNPASGEPAKDAKPTEPVKPAEPTKLFAGRFKTPEDLEIAYQESSTEGLRLYQEQRSSGAKLAERDAQIVELQDQVKLFQTQAPFKEMSKEELKELATNDPLAAAEYVSEKKFRDRDLAQMKTRLKEERESQAQSLSQTRNRILARGEAMLSDTTKYPDYEALIPDMERLSEKLGDDIKDKEWAPDVLYLVAMGRRYLQSQQKGKVSTEEAAKKAAEAAAALAGASGPGGQPPASVPKNDDPNSDQAVMDRILKASQGTIFGKV